MDVYQNLDVIFKTWKNKIYFETDVSFLNWFCSLLILFK